LGQPLKQKVDIFLANSHACVLLLIFRAICDSSVGADQFEKQTQMNKMYSKMKYQPANWALPKSVVLYFLVDVIFRILFAKKLIVKTSTMYCRRPIYFKLLEKRGALSFPAQNKAIVSVLKVILFMNIAGSTYASLIFRDTIAFSESTEHAFHMLYF
jgi:hypothetical protein